ncbi:hypothetical protein GCM10017562_07070 [Streptomyces roseofulvus]
MVRAGLARTRGTTCSTKARICAWNRLTACPPAERAKVASAGPSKGVPVSDMAEWLGRLRNLTDAVFTREAELTPPLGFDALLAAA